VTTERPRTGLDAGAPGVTPTPTPQATGTAETAPDPAAAPAYLPHRQILVVMSGLMAGMFLAALDQSIVGTALPRITSELGGLDHLSWVVTAYLLTSTASTPLWGKISDLYGRRPIFQVAIVVFLLGSVLAGLAQNMPQLIGGRAVQGLGGGGLMALALATIGDVVPPRERGRYQGFFGAVFGLSSVLGPLLGGWFTDGPGWRWIFWINVPIGIGSLVVTSLALRIPRVRREHAVDYLGAALVVGAVTSLLLYLAWAGNELGWGDPFSLALLAASAVLTVAFVLVELRVAEPIIPMQMFALPVFRWGVIYTTILGSAMFGAIIYLPLYLQVVKGMTPTESGLALLPMVVGVFLTSIGSGNAITRTGRYRAFPIVGAAVTIAGLAMLAQLGRETPYWQVAVSIFVLGAGLGFTMQTLVVAVQNAVPPRDLGAATSAVTFFRSMGGALGTAVFGAVLTSRLGVYLAENLGTTGAAVEVNVDDVSAIAALPPEVKVKVLDSFVQALQDVFVAAIPFVVVALVVAFLIPEVRLRTRHD
jgi:EmrB/QacA subfamily drug resistance transporter